MTVSFAVKPHVVPSTDAPRYEFFGCNTSILAGGEETAGSYSLSEHRIPAGAGTPPHIHHNEDEAFYVLDGEVTIWCGADSYVAGAGDFALLPRGVRHHWLNTGRAVARMLVMTNPAGFERFIIAASTPARDTEIPPLPEFSELSRIMTEVAPRYGIEQVEGV